MQGRQLFDDDEFGKNLEVLLENGANINFYMFHGGTNFGFTNGGLTVARGWDTADVTRQGKFYFRKLSVFPIRVRQRSAHP